MKSQKIIKTNGSECWILVKYLPLMDNMLPFSMLHKQYGPAYISADKKLSHWVINGRRHRIDGPATLGDCSTTWPTSWYLHGILWYLTHEQV